jgi:hypothetical protein
MFFFGAVLLGVILLNVLSSLTSVGYIRGGQIEKQQRKFVRTCKDFTGGNNPLGVDAINLFLFVTDTWDE